MFIFGSVCGFKDLLIVESVIRKGHHSLFSVTNIERTVFIGVIECCGNGIL